MDSNYLITKDSHSRLKKKIIIQDYYLHYNDIPLTHKENENSTIVLLGEPMDCFDPDKSLDLMTSELVELSSLNEVIERSKYFLGRFAVVYYSKRTGFYIIPDATCTIPVNYMNHGDYLEIASNTLFLSEKHNLKYSEEAKKINKMSEEQQPLPFNITLYDEIKVLIPNHYLDVSKKIMVRFFPITKKDDMSLDEVVKETIKVMDLVIPKIMQKEKVTIPITAGIDSRTLVALFREYIKDIPLYTFYDKGKKDIWDVKIPEQLAARFDLDYHPIERIKISDSNYQKLARILDGQQNKNVLTAGFTLSESEISGRRNIPGDIIPIAKSNFGKNLPDSFATIPYLVTKTHNYSSEIKKHVKDWKKDAENDYGVSIFDLYFWEYRFGRWLPKSIANYDVVGNPYYIFNCRYLVEMWVSINRKERTEKSFHKEIIKHKWPELLEIPVNPGNSLFKNVFSNQYAYYAGSFLKYYLKRFK